MIRDVTERREAEQALLESQQMVRLLVEQSPMAVILWDLEFLAIEWNPAATRVFGFSKEEMRDHPATERIVPPQLLEPVVQVFRDLCEQKGGYRSTNENLAKDGRIIFCEWYNTPLLDANGNTVGVASLVNDVTERVTAEQKRREMEQRMVQTQKLESLGVLAGGIAHDFNNLLVGVLGNAGLALADLPEDSSVRSAVEQIERTALRAADLTRQLLAYSGKGRFVILPVNLTNLVGEMLELLMVSISKSATLETQLAADLPCIEADATQIRQVIMSLLINASDALEGAAGTIRIRTALIHMSTFHIGRMIQSANALQPGRYVCLEITDTGRGMDAGNCERIFDPFFSTKQTGRGLGPAAVQGIVRGGRRTGARSVRRARRPVRPGSARPDHAPHGRGAHLCGTAAGPTRRARAHHQRLRRAGVHPPFFRRRDRGLRPETAPARRAAERRQARPGRLTRRRHRGRRAREVGPPPRAPLSPRQSRRDGVCRPWRATAPSRHPRYRTRT